MLKTVSFRALIKTDYQSVADCANVSFKKMTKYKKEDIEFLTRLPEWTRTVGGFQDNKCMAYVVALGNPFIKNKYAQIAELAVRPEARRKYVATKIMRQVIYDIKKDFNPKMVFLHTELDNYPAQKLYYKLGFRYSKILDYDYDADKILPQEDQRFIMIKRFRYSKIGISNN